jgi:adenylate kinase family enzyme
MQPDRPVVPTSIVYLLGYPGVGKYTIGREIAMRTGAVLLDNHVINDPILALLHWNGKSALPAGTLDRTAPIREAVLSALEEIAPPSLSYVLTNVLSEESADVALYERVKQVAQRRASLFLPVLLTCATDVQLRRVATEERARRRKISDPDSVRRFMETTALYTPADAELLELDTTSASPKQTAALIVETIRRSANRGQDPPES